MTHKKQTEHSQHYYTPFNHFATAQTVSNAFPTRAAGTCGQVLFYGAICLNGCQRVISECVCLSLARMAPKQTEGGGGRVKIPDKLTDAEKKKKKQENKAKANPEKVRRAEIVLVRTLGPLRFRNVSPRISVHKI